MVLLSLSESYLRSVDLEMQVSYCQAKLALLLHVSQTRFGAAAVINAGLFQSVKASRLFSTDPDLGAGMQIPNFHGQTTNNHRHRQFQSGEDTLYTTLSSHASHQCRRN